jgi:hypothetical protein
MNGAQMLVIQALREPERVPGWPIRALDGLIRQARQANLLARLSVMLDEAGALERIPAAPRNHFTAARILAEKHTRDVRWEVHCLRRAIGAETKMVLLKGAAYVLADLPSARGRTFSDIDIMVPKAELDEVEQALLRSGWTAGKLNPYDQLYYRTWMHQIPPLVHKQRETVVDVHHTIVPETARSPVAASTLFDAAQPVAGSANIYVLAPADMVLHSAVHLFNGGEYEIGLRDICDIHDLLCHFGKDSAFWSVLWQRATETDLTTPLYLALHYSCAFLNTPLPAPMKRVLEVYQHWHPAVRLLQPIVSRAVCASGPRGADPLTAVARWLLYVRGHYLRMPMRLLVPHLVRKAVRGRLAAQ